MKNTNREGKIAMNKAACLNIHQSTRKEEISSGAAVDRPSHDDALSHAALGSPSADEARNHQIEPEDV